MCGGGGTLRLHGALHGRGGLPLVHAAVRLEEWVLEAAADRARAADMSMTNVDSDALKPRQTLFYIKSMLYMLSKCYGEWAPCRACARTAGRPFTIAIFQRKTVCKST